jgi:hypothetical protein
MKKLEYNKATRIHCLMDIESMIGQTDTSFTPVSPKIRVPFIHIYKINHNSLEILQIQGDFIENSIKLNTSTQKSTFINY